MRLKFLDIGRAFAVLYVLFYHSIEIWKFEYPKALTQLIQSGGSGVTLFFVISAFSLCLTMERRQQSARPLASYAIARVFRILPLYYFMLALTLWRDVDLRPMVHEAPKILAAATLSFNLFPEYAEGIVWASWSVGVEVVFYALFPLLYKRLNTIERRIAAFLVAMWATYAVAAFLLPMLPPEDARPYIYMNIVRNLAVFLVGMIAYDVYKLLERSKIERRADKGLALTAIGLTLIGFFIVTVRLTWKISPLAVDWGIVQAIAYSTALIGLSLLPQQAIANPVSAFYSRVCYSAYLWHPFIIWALKPYYDFVHATFDGPWLRVAGIVGGTLFVVSIVSEISYRLIELPGQNAGKRLLRTLETRPVTRSGAAA